MAKTIIYNLNPADNEVVATMLGNFHGRGTRGKLQFGASWWFLDQKDGMEKQMNTLLVQRTISTSKISLNQKILLEQALP